MVLLGLILGPVIGMLIAEYSSKDPDSFGAAEDGFVGFLYGLRGAPACVWCWVCYWLSARRTTPPGSNPAGGTSFLTGFVRV